MNLFFDVGMMISLLCIAFFGILVAVSIFDLNKMKIPNMMCAVIFVLGVLSIFFIKEISVLDRLLGAVVVSVPMLGITSLAGKGFGGGDIKLMSVSGVFMGAKLITVGAFLGLIMAGIYILVSFVVKNKDIKSGFALGPCLSIGIIISCMLGEQIWHMIF